MVGAVREDTALQALFKWSDVDLATGCWEWLGRLDHHGYGLYACQLNGRSESIAHRVFFKLLKGEIPDGYDLDHLCRNRPCVNPDHLEPVSKYENHGRGAQVQKSYCVRGHPLYGDNLMVHIAGSYVTRACKICNREAVARYQARKKLGIVSRPYQKIGYGKPAEPGTLK